MVAQPWLDYAGCYLPVEVCIELDGDGTTSPRGSDDCVWTLWALPMSMALGDVPYWRSPPIEMLAFDAASRARVSDSRLAATLRPRRATTTRRTKTKNSAF
jgi:hypothetical protein